MPGQRGVTSSFADELAKVHQAVAMAKLAPDADMDFIGELENQILSRLKPPAPDPAMDPLAAIQASMGAPGGAPGAAPAGPGGPPQAVPMTPAPTRIPGTSPDMREATAALEAEMSGTV